MPVSNHSKWFLVRLYTWARRPLSIGCLAAAVLMLVLSTVSVAGSQPEAGVRLLAADSDGVTLEVLVPNYQSITLTGADGQSYVQLSIPGYISVGLPGQPALPQRSVLIAVPPAAKLSLDIEVLAEQHTHLSWPVYPAPALVADPSTDDPALATGVREVFVRDERSYLASGAVPETLAVLEEAGYMRDHRLARLTLYPLQYISATGHLRHVQRMRVHVIFSEGKILAPQPTFEDPGGFSALVAAAVVNPQQVEMWRANPPAPAAPPATLPFEQPRYRITTRQAGIYQLTYADLTGAGLPVATLDPRHLRVYHGPDELAIEVVGEEDGRFDPADVVRFYAEKVESFFTDRNNYWLVIGDGPGRRMSRRSAAPQGATPAPGFLWTQHYEENVFYRSSMPMASDVDHWYWGQTYVLSRGSVVTLTVPFTVEHPLLAGSATLVLEAWGASSDARVNPDHHWRVYVNDTAVGDLYWDGAVAYRSSLSFDQSLLHAGANALTLYAPGDTGAKDVSNQPWEVSWLNFFDLTYARAYQAVGDRLPFTPPSGPGEFEIAGWSDAELLVYDITDPRAPVRLEGVAVRPEADGYVLRMHDQVPVGGAYYAVAGPGIWAPLMVAVDSPSDLHGPATGADYLIITHADFREGIGRLAQFRRQQGLRVQVVDVQDIYDEFNAGLLSPHAIRAFISYAYFHWPTPAPSYVLLVGDGTYDFLNYEGRNVPTFVPPFLAAADPILGETAADNRYVAVVGDDLMPDLHLGRLPVNSQAELTAMVDKIITYEESPTPGTWQRRAVFVADNPDSAGDFHQLSDLAVGYLPGEFQVQKIYLGSAEYPLSFAARAQQATLDAFNQGALLFNYVGHSSIGNWASELLFGVTSLAQLTNSGRYPVVLPMTCLEGSYHNPRFPSLGENVVRLSGRGAVASWSPTGLGVASGHDYLHQGFYEAVFNQGLRRLGPATTAGKLNLFINGRFPDGTPRFHDLLDTYVLLGDPATSLLLSEAQLSVVGSGPAGQLSLGDPVTYTFSYSNGGPIGVSNLVLTATLPAHLEEAAWSSSDPMLSLRPGTRFTWDLAVLGPGAGGQVTITGRVAWDLTAADLPFSVELTVSSPWPESDYSDNRAGPLILSLAPADLALKQSLQPASAVQPGQMVTFTLACLNNGPGSAGGITLTLPLPFPLQDLRLSNSGVAATLRPGLPYVWDLAPMRVGDVARLVVSGLIPTTLPLGPSAWSVAGWIGTTWLDPNPDNNRGEASTLTILIRDQFEPDDGPGQATRVTLPVREHRHSYYPEGDQDWVVFGAVAGRSYLIRANVLTDKGNMMLLLADAAGNLVAKSDDQPVGSGISLILWTAPASGDYYLMATSYTSPPGLNYDLKIAPVERTHLPLLMAGAEASELVSSGSGAVSSPALP